jgi:hypothetical protein
MGLKERIAELLGKPRRSLQARARGSQPPPQVRRPPSRESSKLDQALDSAMRQLDRQERDAQKKAR